jgi:hypothetical protein
MVWPFNKKKKVVKRRPFDPNNLSAETRREAEALGQKFPPTETYDAGSGQEPLTIPVEEGQPEVKLTLKDEVIDSTPSPAKPSQITTEYLFETRLADMLRENNPSFDIMPDERYPTSKFGLYRSIRDGTLILVDWDDKRARLIFGYESAYDYTSGRDRIVDENVASLVIETQLNPVLDYWGTKGSQIVFTLDLSFEANIPSIEGVVNKLLEQYNGGLPCDMGKAIDQNSPPDSISGSDALNLYHSLHKS